MGGALGHVYQALCGEDNEGALEALHAIETLLTKRGVLVPRPKLRTQEGGQTDGE